MLPDDLDLGLLQQTFPGRTFRYQQVVDSTMLRAEKGALEGLPDGSVFLADVQTAGMGRQGRSWHSPVGAGLYFSVLLSQELAPYPPQLTLALGLAVHDSLDALTGLDTELKWPNDVMVGPRKLCGILVHHQRDVLIAGIGINVRSCAMPDDLEGTAISLEEASGIRIARDVLLIDLLPRIDRMTGVLRSLGPAPVIEEFTRKSRFVTGREVEVELDGTPVRGVTAGLDDSGFLWIQTAEGQQRRVLGGGVRLVGESK